MRNSFELGSIGVSWFVWVKGRGIRSPGDYSLPVLARQWAWKELVHVSPGLSVGCSQPASAARR